MSYPTVMILPADDRLKGIFFMVEVCPGTQLCQGILTMKIKIMLFYIISQHACAKRDFKEATGLSITFYHFVHGCDFITFTHTNKTLQTEQKCNNFKGIVLGIILICLSFRELED